MKGPKLRFRHVFGELHKEKYENIKPSTVISESGVVKGNSLYCAFSWQTGGGGCLAILKNNNPCKLPAEFPAITGHSGPITDFDFNPFNDHMLVTASEDTTVKFWQLPEELAPGNISEPLAELRGHGKKVNLVSFNPSAEYIVASASGDETVKVWNLQKSADVFSISGVENATSIDWNHDGSLIGSIWKDKKTRVIDPRQSKVAVELPGSEGPKSQKLAWLGNTGYLVSTGYSKTLQREYLLWDMKNTEKPVETKPIDQGAGALHPYYDADLGILYLAGKGDGNLRYFEFAEGNLHFLTQYTSNVSSRSWGFYPKRCVDVTKNEVAKCMKLNNDNLEFISFIAPRKDQNFQEDLFPDCHSEVPALSADEWWSGKTAEPKTRSMRPGTVFDKKESTQSFNKSGSGVEDLHSKIKELQTVIEEKNNRIHQLEQQVEELKAALENK